MDPQKQKENIDEDFRHYRSVGGVLVGAIITLASGVIFSVLSRDANIAREWFSLLGFSVIFIFVSLLLGLFTLYYIFQGYYRKANKGVGQDMGNPNDSFRCADRLVYYTLGFFVVGVCTLFLIYFFEFFNG